MSLIEEIHAREILDSRGNPTVEAAGSATAPAAVTKVVARIAPSSTFLTAITDFIVIPLH